MHSLPLKLCRLPTFLCGLTSGVIVTLVISLVTVKQEYDKGIITGGDVPVQWCRDMVGDIGFGKIAEYDVGGFLTRGDMDVDKVKVFRRSEEAIEKTAAAMRHTPSVEWITKEFQGIKTSMAILRNEQDPLSANARKIYLLSWKAKNGTNMGMVISQFTENTKITSQVEHLLATMDVESYEKKYPYNLQDIGPTEFGWWNTWIWTKEPSLSR